MSKPLPTAMSKPALLCLCLGLLVGCRTPVHPWLLDPPQVLRPDAAKAEFFRRIHYPYYASKERRRRIEQAAHDMNVNQTPAQVLAELGPPDWKEMADGYPPKIPPSQVWYYVHTLERPLGPHYHGKLIGIDIEETTPPTIDTMEIEGLQKVGR